MTYFWIIIAIILIVFSLDQLIERMYRYEIKKNHKTPEKHNIAFEEVDIPGEKDTHLYGWWIPTSPDAPTLILVHGWGRNLSRMLPYIQNLHPLGYNLLAFDARNHGNSSPTKHPTVGTFTEDILAALKFISQSGWVTNETIGIVGLSVGGSAAINAASWDDRVKSVVTVGAFSHPIEVMKLEFQKRKIPDFIPWFVFGYMRLRYGFNFDKLAPINNIKRSNAEIFLVHGDQDETIPLEQGKALAEAGIHARTRMWVVHGKGHSDCNTHAHFWEKVGAFLKATLSVPERETLTVEVRK